MITNTISAFEAPRQKSSFFLEDSDEPGMATSYQKRTLYRLLCENMEDGEAREVNINQIPYVSEDEARSWIAELENSIW
ncbi:MAG: hypothetical protein WCW29_04460 [Candidatus Paceibacterota bacterium]|jgi:hypothetical protein